MNPFFRTLFFALPIVLVLEDHGLALREAEHCVRGEAGAVERDRLPEARADDLDCAVADHRANRRGLLQRPRPRVSRWGTSTLRT